MQQNTYNMTMREIGIEMNMGTQNVQRILNEINVKLLIAMAPEFMRRLTKIQQTQFSYTCKPSLDELLSDFVANNPSLSESRRYLDIGETL